MNYYLILYLLIHEYFTIIVKVVKLEKSWPLKNLIFADFLIAITFARQLVTLYGHFLETFLGFIIQFISNIQTLIFLSLILYV